MIADGVIARRGRSWYGRAVDIDAWLLGRWPATPTATGATERAARDTEAAS
jgi:hypothetical protein